ncbi:MAG: hypothetical protein ACOX62_11495 [Christensenellales bacterium]|jgi:hypothetical protein
MIINGIVVIAAKIIVIAAKIIVIAAKIIDLVQKDLQNKVGYWLPG